MALCFIKIQTAEIREKMCEENLRKDVVVTTCCIRDPVTSICNRFFLSPAGILSPGLVCRICYCFQGARPAGQR